MLSEMNPFHLLSNISNNWKHPKLFLSSTESSTELREMKPPSLNSAAFQAYVDSELQIQIVLNWVSSHAIHRNP